MVNETEKAKQILIEKIMENLDSTESLIETLSLDPHQIIEQAALDKLCNLTLEQLVKYL